MTSAREPRLIVDRDSIGILRSVLDQTGFDLAHESLRADYLISPFPHFEEFSVQLGQLEPALGLALRLLSLGEAIDIGLIERWLGRDFLEASLATGLLAIDAEGTQASTAGLALGSRLGQYFVVSSNPYYPGFDPALSDIYLGPESFTLVNHLQRRAGSLASVGRALDLGSGSGIAGQSIAAIRRGLEWTAVDISPLAVEASTFNAALNDMSGRYRAVQGDLYEAAGTTRYALIVSNPPFIPVPEDVPFPIYGNGGEDGMSVLRPLLAGLGKHLTAEGRAIIYAEGIGNERGPFLLDLLEEVAAGGHAVGVTLVGTMTRDQALFSIGRLLSMQKPSRLDELARWQDSFAQQGVTRYDKMLIEVRPGTSGLVIRSAVGKVAG